MDQNGHLSSILTTSLAHDNYLFYIIIIYNKKIFLIYKL